MADFFYGLDRPTGPLTMNNLTVGTSSSSGKAIELRVNQTLVTKMDVRMAVHHILFYLEQCGFDRNGTNIPII